MSPPPIDTAAGAVPHRDSTAAGPAAPAVDRRNDDDGDGAPPLPTADACPAPPHQQQVTTGAAAATLPARDAKLPHRGQQRHHTTVWQAHPCETFPTDPQARHAGALLVASCTPGTAAVDLDETVARRLLSPPNLRLRGLRDVFRDLVEAGLLQPLQPRPGDLWCGRYQRTVPMPPAGVCRYGTGDVG